MYFVHAANMLQIHTAMLVQVTWAMSSLPDNPGEEDWDICSIHLQADNSTGLESSFLYL